MSSDSEDDFYGNMTERLQKEKEKFIEHKMETDNLFDDSGELDEIVKNNKLPPKTTRKKKGKPSEETPGCSTTDLPEVTVDSASNSPPKRMTRARAKRTSVALETDVNMPPPKTKPRKKVPKTTQKSTPDGGNDLSASDGSENESGSIFDDILSSPARRGGRGRGRGARGRGRGRGTPRRRNRGRRGWFWAPRDADFNDLLALMFPMRSRQIQSWDPSIPTYSVGNTEEYEDQSYNQPLFSNTNKEKPKTDEVIELEEENLDDNEELSVKVYWQSSEFFKFSIRRFQTLKQIFDYFAKKENVTHDKLLFMYNEKILTPNDTPDSIDYSIVKFIDGGIVTQGVLDLITKDNETIKDGITLKFQAKDLKKPMEITIREDDKLSVAMMKCAELLNKRIETLKFEFDGDSISGKSTARELEFEGGECIDVKVVS